jgi:monothiol glutaredoxin
MSAVASRICARARGGDRDLPYKLASIESFANKTAMSNVQQRIDELVKSNHVVLFMKGTAQFPMCGFSGRAIQILKAAGATNVTTVNVLEDNEVRQGIKEYANWPTIPQLYINGEFVGGSDILMEMHEAGELQQMLSASH